MNGLTHQQWIKLPGVKDVLNNVLNALFCVVAGQVVNVMRESQAHRVAGYRPTVTSHIKIPAAYKGGISLFVRKDSDVYKELIEAPELPLKEPEGACARQR